MASKEIPIGCLTPGLHFSEQMCCYPGNQTQHSCRKFIGQNPDQLIFPKACPSGNCFKDCQDTKEIYGGIVVNHGILNMDTVQRYMACVAVPAIAGYDGNGIFPATGETSLIRQLIPPMESTEENLRGVTAAVTECLTQTCQEARNKTLCFDEYCAPTRLLINATTPNQTAINQCLNTLCLNGFEVVPFPDTDIIGIGIFSSYVLQIIFVAILWFGVIIRSLAHSRRDRIMQGTPGPEFGDLAGISGAELGDIPSGSWLRFVLEFHKAQCYFAGTLMIAIFVSGIVDIDVAMIFMLLPLTMNGIVPVVFVYLMLYYHRLRSSAITFLTFGVYTISTVAFWLLYANLISFTNSYGVSYNAFSAYMYELSHIDACGGFSALTVCPDHPRMGRAKAHTALKMLWHIPPVAWGISTAVFSVVLVAKGWARKRQRRSGAAPVLERDNQIMSSGSSKRMGSTRVTSIAF